MSIEYPNKCCRCGFCCLTETCPIGQAFYKISEETRCPGLSFDLQGQATCELAQRGLVPIGDGCCIKARAYRNNTEYDFASLPNEFKYSIVRQVRIHREMLLNIEDRLRGFV